MVIVSPTVRRGPVTVYVCAPLVMAVLLVLALVIMHPLGLLAANKRSQDVQGIHHLKSVDSGLLSTGLGGGLASAEKPYISRKPDTVQYSHDVLAEVLDGYLRGKYTGKVLFEDQDFKLGF